MAVFNGLLLTVFCGSCLIGVGEFDISGSLGTLKVNDATGIWDCHSPTDSAWLSRYFGHWQVLFAVALYKLPHM